MYMLREIGVKNKERKVIKRKKKSDSLCFYSCVWVSPRPTLKLSSRESVWKHLIIWLNINQMSNLRGELLGYSRGYSCLAAKILCTSLCSRHAWVCMAAQPPIPIMLDIAMTGYGHKSSSCKISLFSKQQSCKKGLPLLYTLWRECKKIIYWKP